MGGPLNCPSRAAVTVLSGTSKISSVLNVKNVNNLTTRRRCNINSQKRKEPSEMIRYGSERK